MKRVLFAAAIVLAACGGPTDGSKDSPFIAGFTPPAQPAGYTRYVTPVIKGIKPGEDKLVCQWLAGPAATDQDVVDLSGAQSKFGHHVVLYATPMKLAPGTTRDCGGSVMASDLRYEGALGGEGTNSVAMPPGYVFRLPKGYSLMANVHFINLSHADIDGQAVLDLKTRPVSDTDQVANIITSIDTALDVPPGAYSHDVDCTVTSDISVLMWANHMHQYGTSATSELVHADGSKETLVTNTPWRPEDVFNPQYRVFPVDAPLELHPGDVLHTHCEWNNTTNDHLTFGLEMCVGVGFYVKGGTGMLVCDGGQWSTQ